MGTSWSINLLGFGSPAVEVKGEVVDDTGRLVDGAVITLVVGNENGGNCARSAFLRKYSEYSGSSIVDTMGRKARIKNIIRRAFLEIIFILRKKIFYNNNEKMN